MTRHDLIALGVVVIFVAGCGGPPVLANPPAQPPVATPGVAPSPSRLPDPQPVVLPADDAPHERLTEWWYYTGHLHDQAGNRYGFEFVVFRAERGTFPVAWASHFAVTDETGKRFIYGQRSEVGPQVDRSASGRAAGFDFALGRQTAPTATAWTLTGSNGIDRLAAMLTPEEARTAGVTGLALELSLRSTKPAALHDHDGWIDFGSAGGSYYYSRTRMTADGDLVLDGKHLLVDGEAWFDHQWGDFIAVGGGGWDWFAVNLADGTDLTLSLVRDRDGSYPLVYGTRVDPDGTTHHLDRSAFSVEVTEHWTSPVTGATYPAGWRVSVPEPGLDLRLTPTVPDQELDTRATSGVVYWEGSQRVVATDRGNSVGGQAYVELTGFGPAASAAP
ncbi:MAG: lipocalin family protein [Chloroflexota bacterium]